MSTYSVSETATGDRWIDGRTIYRKVIVFPTGPNVVQLSIPHGIVSRSLPTFIKIQPMMIGFSGQDHLPFQWLTEDLTPINALSVKADEVNVYITPTFDQGQDWSSFHGFVILEYVKGA